MCLCSTSWCMEHFSNFTFHVLRISLSLHLQTRDKESSEPKLTSWSLLLNAPTADQDKATQCAIQQKLVLGRNPSILSWSSQGILKISTILNKKAFARVLMKESLKDLFHWEICGNKVVSSPSRSAFDLNVHGVNSQHPFTPPYPFTIYRLETADANLICFAFQTVLNNHDSWIPKSVVKQR